jgi:ferric-dicitrate binding protein FerR (iron transport regulator)
LLSLSQKQALDEWLNASPDNLALKNDILESINYLEDFEPDFDVDLNKDFDLIQSKLASKKKNSKHLTLTRPFSWLAIAATFLFLFATTFLFFQSQNSPPPIEWTSIQTKIGEKTNITLADGSKVWLNENSTLTFPKKFSNDQRLIRLDGEIFIEVYKDPQKLFIIETTLSKIQVLGTSFNLNAYSSKKKTIITVQTGKVLFSDKDGNNQITLTKAQEAVLNHQNNEITNQDNVLLNALSWKDQKLSFKNTPLTSLFKILEKHFQVKIICENPHLKNCAYSMTRQKINLDTLLNNLKLSYQIEIKKGNAKTYFISKGNCTSID